MSETIRWNSGTGSYREAGICQERGSSNLWGTRAENSELFSPPSHEIFVMMFGLLFASFLLHVSQ